MRTDRLYPNDFEFFWGKVRFNLKSSSYFANTVTLRKFYEASLKNMDSKMRLTRFEFDKNDYGGRTYTIIDGVIASDDGVYPIWTLPWHNYLISVGENSNPSNKNVSSVVENAIILLWLNGMALTYYLQPSENYDSLIGMEFSSLIYFTRHLLSACCFFYSNHILFSTRTKVSIELFLRLCAANFYQRLTTYEYANENINGIIDSVLERNKINFRSRYGHGKTSSPVRVTVGNATRGEKHSITMTKYGKDIDEMIRFYYPSCTIRELTKFLNDEGIDISKSTVSRRIKQMNLSKNKTDGING